MGIIEDLQQKLKDNQVLLENVSRMATEKERIHGLLRESIRYEMKNGVGIAQTQEFVSWFEQAEAFEIRQLKDSEAYNRWKHRFTQPTMSESTDMFRTAEMSPLLVMQRVQDEMKHWLSDYDTTVDVKLIQTVNERIQEIAVTIQSLQYGKEGAVYGKASVELTKTNILLSVLIPSGILVLTFIGTVLFETYKNGITAWIRCFFHHL